MSERKISAFPLTWPEGWKRTPTRARARFENHSMATATHRVLEELRMLGVPDWSIVISTNVELRLDGQPRSNQRAPSDPGVSVWFSIGERMLTVDDAERCRKVLACDRWDCVEHNLWAIGQHIAAMRGQGRWGVGSTDQAFRGYAALPAPRMDWRSVLGECRTPDDVSAAYRARASAAHPDGGGSAEAFDNLTKARKAALLELSTAGPVTRSAP